MTRRVDCATRLLYGIGAVAFGVKDNGFSFFLLLYYNQVLGLPERWVGLGIMLALFIDGLVDPIIGHFSDHLHARWGRRHPFMYAAAVPVAVTYWLLWNPPANLTPGALFAYFVVVSIVVRIAISLYEIPSASLVPELTDQYDERTAILGYRFFFGWWGGLGIAVLAYALFLQPDAAHLVGVLNPAGYRHYGLAAACIMLLAILVSAVGTHRFIPYLRQPPVGRRLGIRGIFGELVETLSNPSFLALFGAGIFAAMGAGLTAAMSIYINTYFWQLTSTQISVLVLSSFVSAAIALAGAPIASQRLGKKPAAIGISIAALVIGPGPLVLRLLDAFPDNGSPLLMPLLFVFNMTTVALVIVSSILTSSMAADVVEDSEMSTGRRSEGVFVAANAFVQKAVSGVGIFASTLILALIGFPADAKPGEVDPVVVRRLALAFAPAVITVYSIAIVFLSSYRIDREVHEGNLRKLAERAAVVPTMPVE